MITLSAAAVDAVKRARAERDAGFNRAEAGAAKDADKTYIDQVIEQFAATRRPFSANDVRPHLVDVSASLIGSRFYAARVAGRINPIGLTTSTKKNTHAKPVACWIGAPK